jgi:hypothetical protein
MAKLIAEEHKDFQLLPPDSILFLKVAGCEVREVERRNGGTWQKLEFTFQIAGIQQLGNGSNPAEYGEAVGTNIWGSAPFKLTDSPENKLKRWVEAILGLEITKGFELDTDYLVNRDVRGTTSVYDKRITNQQTGRPYQGHQIEDLLPKGSGNNVLGGWGGQSQTARPAQQQPAQQPAQDPTFNWDEPPF